MNLKRKLILTGIGGIIFYKLILPGILAANSTLVAAALFAALFLLWVVYKIWSQEDAFQNESVRQTASEGAPTDTLQSDLGDTAGSVQETNKQV